MTFKTEAIAFLTTRPHSNHHKPVLSSFLVPSVSPSSCSEFSLNLFSKAHAAAAMVDHTASAVSYFASIRIPAALIAGSSLSALFTLVDESSDAQSNKRTQLQSIVLLLYNIFALLSLLLSLNVIVTSTATGNSILLGCDNPLAPNAFELLKREFLYEFLITRWSFFASLFSFLGCIAARLLIEFDLLRRKRVRSALLVLFAVGTLFFHLVSFVNHRLYCHDNLAAMTVAVGAMWFQRCVTGRGPAQLASVTCFMGALCMTVSLFLRSRLFSIRPNNRSSLLDSQVAVVGELDGIANDGDRITSVTDDTFDGDDMDLSLHQ